MSGSNGKRYRLRIVVPAFPGFNIYSSIASITTALGPVCVASAVNEMEGWDAEVIDENNLGRYGPRGPHGGADHDMLQEQRPADVVGFYGGLTSTIPQPVRAGPAVQAARRHDHRRRAALRRRQYRRGAVLGHRLRRSGRRRVDDPRASGRRAGWPRCTRHPRHRLLAEWPGGQHRAARAAYGFRACSPIRIFPWSAMPGSRSIRSSGCAAAA